MIMAFVQARMDSERLAGKSMLPLGSSVVVWATIQRVLSCHTIDRVILVSKDPILFEYSCTRGIQCSADESPGRDVLREFWVAAQKFEPDTIVRITGDCPCVCPQEIDRAVIAHENSYHDYTYNRCDNEPGGFVDGMDVEVFNAHALNLAWDSVYEYSDREHVTPWIRRSMLTQRIEDPLVKLDPRLKLSIDTMEDYQRIKLLYDRLPLRFTTTDILNVTEGELCQFIQTEMV